MPSVTAARLQIIAQGAGHGALPRLVARAGEAAPRPYKGVVHHRAGVYPTHIGSA
jgi:hypothetical protein